MTNDVSPMGRFERWLTLWVGLCIVAGVAIGALLPNLFQTLAKFEYAHVNLVVAIFIWINDTWSMYAPSGGKREASKTWIYLVGPQYLSKGMGLNKAFSAGQSDGTSNASTIMESL